MTSPTAEPFDSAHLLNLVQRCSELCATAERSVRKLSPERESFLAHNLEGALLQLELILRVLGERREGGRDAERQSLLRRLFARSGAKDAATETIEAPSFDVSAQGLQGNSWTVSIAEIVGFLAFANKTGLLWVDSPSGNYIVGVVSGRLMHASSDHTPEGLRLGEVLVGLGFLTRRQLERYLATRAEGETVSGEKLLEAGMISDDELREALGYQVKKLFNKLIRTEHAVFRFQEGVKVQLAYQVDLDINQLLLDSARKRDEAVSPAQQAATLLHEWNSWRTELDGKFAAHQAGKPAGATEALDPAASAQVGSAPTLAATGATAGTTEAPKPAHT